MALGPQVLFPPTPTAWGWIWTVFSFFPLAGLVQLTPLSKLQLMGKTSSDSKHWTNLPGRYAWALAEAVGPLNLIYIFYTLPSRIKPVPESSTSVFGTGLPIQHEIMGLLYVLHYVNRAGVTPLLLAPSMSPIHVLISLSMATFQFLNSSNLACWIIYSFAGHEQISTPILSASSVVGISLFVFGLAGNIIAENELFSMRRSAAKRKAKSEGKAIVTFDKVYVIPPVQGLYKYVLFPHYSLEWIEWTGYWILGGAWGFGWSWTTSAALLFLINEFAAMAPRAISGVDWYSKKFGKKPVAGRKAVLPGIL